MKETLLGSGMPRPSVLTKDRRALLRLEGSTEGSTARSMRSPQPGGRVMDARSQGTVQHEDTIFYVRGNIQFA